MDDDHIRSTPRFESQPARPTADELRGQTLTDARPAAKDRIAFVDIGRALAALLVFYSHIHVVWMRRDNGVSSPVTDGVTWAFANPLHLDQQDIGQIGIPIFFLISGFVITPIAMRQGMSRFAVNRALRIYVPLVFAVLLTGTLLTLGLDPLWTGQLREVTPLTLLTNSLLVNYLIYPQAVLLGVTWTLVVEVIFYLLLIVLLPAFRRSVWLGIAIELVIVHLVLMSRSELGPSWSLFAVNVSFIPILLCGQIVWAAFHRKIPLWLAGGYLALSWALYVSAAAGHGQAGRLLQRRAGLRISAVPDRTARRAATATTGGMDSPVRAQLFALPAARRDRVPGTGRAVSGAAHRAGRRPRGGRHVYRSRGQLPTRRSSQPSARPLAVASRPGGRW